MSVIASQTIVNHETKSELYKKASGIADSILPSKIPVTTRAGSQISVGIASGVCLWKEDQVCSPVRRCVAEPFCEAEIDFHFTNL